MSSKDDDRLALLIQEQLENGYIVIIGKSDTYLEESLAEQIYEARYAKDDLRETIDGIPFAEALRLAIEMETVPLLSLYDPNEQLLQVRKIKPPKIPISSKKGWEKRNLKPISIQKGWRKRNLRIKRGRK